MMKRNEGYALSYVLIVMLVLAAVSMGVMTLALQVLKNQQTSVERMQDRYTAQGMIEQVVAQLERSTVTITKKALENNVIIVPENVTISIPDESKPNCIKVEATCDATKVIAEFTVERLTKVETPPPTGESGESNGTEGTPPVTPEPVTIGHTVTYISYNTEVAP